MQYAEGVVKEFLLFRGFTHTLQSFESELHADVGNGFQVDISYDSPHHQSKRRAPLTRLWIFKIFSVRGRNRLELPSKSHTQILANLGQQIAHALGLGVSKRGVGDGGVVGQAVNWDFVV